MARRRWRPCPRESLFHAGTGRWVGVYAAFAALRGFVGRGVSPGLRALTRLARYDGGMRGGKPESPIAIERLRRETRPMEFRE